MQVTEVRVKLMDESDPHGNGRICAFATIALDGSFVVRDLKVIRGHTDLFVAMPSRKLMDRCHQCGTKNHLRSRFCNHCGCRHDENRALRNVEGRAKLDVDIAHPINLECREMITTAVLDAYTDELERSHEPGYVSTYHDLDDPGHATAAQVGRGASAPIRRRDDRTVHAA